jgi:hypothetical protein
MISNSQLGKTGQVTTTLNNIKTLIAKLDNRDGLIRQRARIALVRIGEPAVDPLIEVLNNRQGYAHWEAAKALSQIGRPKATQALVEALQDDQFSIRWLAAEGLVAWPHRSRTFVESPTRRFRLGSAARRSSPRSARSGQTGIN